MSARLVPEAFAQALDRLVDECPRLRIRAALGFEAYPVVAAYGESPRIMEPFEGLRSLHRIGLMRHYKAGGRVLCFAGREANPARDTPTEAEGLLRDRTPWVGTVTR